jgi:PAS domain S-box-containing protein
MDKYRGLLEAAPDAMVVVNESGKIVIVNLQTEKQFGYSRDELLGQKVTSIIPDGFAERLVADGRRTAAEALAQHIGTGIELIARRKDGTEFPIEIMLSPLASATGVLVTAAIRDITARKAAEKHLAQMEGRYRGLLEAAPDAMVVVNEDGKIVIVNLRTEKQFGYSRDELLGQKVTSIIPEGFAERLVADGQRSAAEALAQQIGTGLELIARRKDGTEFPIELMLSPLDSTTGILVTVAIRDITARRAAAAQLLRKIEELHRLKDEFIASVSHELRTPLTSITASLSLIIGKAVGDLPVAALRLIEIAHTNSQRLGRLVNDILDIEKMESGKVDFHFERVEVGPLVELVIDANRAFAQASGVQIEFENAGAVGAVRADPDRFIQVVTNLLSNAIKFSPPNSVVTVAIETGLTLVHVTVRDRGAGIAADFKPRVFERFEQADVSDARQRSGSGLGLSIVKEIIDRLGGRVGFTDAPGGGTIFRITLPCWDNVVGIAIDFETAANAPRIPTTTMA